MRKVDLIIKTKHLYTMKGEGVGYQHDKSIVIDRGIITAIGNSDHIAQEYTADKYIDATDKMVLPGFVDAHMHTGHGVLRGVAQDINRWMFEGMAPFELARSSEAKTAGSALAITEAIMNGTTTIGDDSSDIRGSLEYIDKVGVRGNVSVRVRSALIKPYKGDELYTFDKNYGEQTLNEALTLFDDFNNRDNERIKIRFGPQGADFLDLDLLKRVKELARERHTTIHMHLAQGAREHAQMMQRYGMRAIPLLSKLGYLDKDFIGIHLTDATDEEIQTVVDSGASMVFCPNSLGVIGGMVPPAVKFLEDGGCVGLGSDQAPGNNSHNIISEMKATSVFNKIKYKSSTIMPAWKCLRMATIEGARAIGIDKLVGSIEVGKHADIICVDLNTPSMAPVYTTPMRNMVPNLVYSARGNEVATVIVDGRILMEEHVPVTFNVQEVVSNAQHHADIIGEKAAPLFNEIHGMNAIYMEEDKL